MDLHTWLDAPENAGKAAWLADQLDRSKAAVSLWREAGVPLEHMPRIQELTGGAVTIDDMVAHKLALLAAQKSAPAAA